jgi:itaconyl-CoA hydratase
MTIIQGGQGRVFEDFEVGDIYQHRLGRTVTQNHNIWFSLITMNTDPIHFDSAFATKTEWETPMVNKVERSSTQN